MIQIHRHRSLMVADQIRKAINRQNTNPELKKSFTFHSYSNGREQGLVLVSMYGRIAFSENRNSDDIVVYVSSVFDKKWDHKDISDEGYANRKYFPYLAYKKAATYIIQKAEEFIVEKFLDRRQ